MKLAPDMRVTIHQPEHIPWTGFFHKLAQVDEFVILDSVQFRKNYFQNRNKIRTATGWSWVTVPVTRNLDTKISEVRIDQSQDWRKKWCDSIYHNYRRAAYFLPFYEQVVDIINAPYELIAELNISLIKAIAGQLGIEPVYRRSSELSINSASSDMILDICTAVDANMYLSGVSGKDYLILDDFGKRSVEVEFQEFHHPIYKQRYEPFIPCMSVLDLIFNYGPGSMSVIRGQGVPVMESIFE